MRVSSRLCRTPFGLIPGEAEGLLTQVERDGLHLQVKERHWLPVLGDLDIDNGCRMAHCTACPLSRQRPSPALLVSCKSILGLGQRFRFVLFCFNIKVESKRVHWSKNGYSVLDSWDSLSLKCPGILVSSTGKCSLWKFQSGQMTIKHFSPSLPAITLVVVR